MVIKSLLLALGLVFFSQTGFAQGTPWAQLDGKFDNLALQELVKSAPEKNCHDPKYVEQVKMYLATSVEYFRFIDSANGAFFQKGVSDVSGELKALNLSACFVEAMFFAVMPDVLKVEKRLRADRPALIRIFAEFATERNTAKDPGDVFAIKTTKMASFAHSLLAISQIRTCHFQDDPWIFLSATFRIQALIDLVYSGMGVLSFVRADACSTQLYKENQMNYLQIVNQKAIYLWGSDGK